MATAPRVTVSNALLTVFLAPARRTPPRLPRPASRLPSRPSAVPTRTFSHTRIPRTAVPERRQHYYDEAIPFARVALVDADNHLTEPRSKSDVLNALDRKEFRLVQLNSPDLDPASPTYTSDLRAFVPVCRVENKKDAYQREKARKARTKEQRRESGRVTSVKTLELNWAIDANDLGHRLEKMEEFLREGRRVEVVLAAKKRGRKASKEECVALLRRIEAVVEGVGGKQFRPMEGGLGRFATWMFQGKLGKAAATSRENQTAVTEEKVND